MPLKYFYDKIGSLNSIYGNGEILINRNNENNISYEIELVNKTVDFLKGVRHKTYRITQVIYKCGVVQKIKISFVIFVVALGWRFGSLSPVEPIIQPLTQIERQLQDSKLTQANQSMEGSESPSVRHLLKISGGDLGKGSSPGAKARNTITNRPKDPKSTKSKPGGSGFAEDRFLELAINPETGFFEEKSIIEVKGGLEAE